MRTVFEWQRLISGAANHKFPNPYTEDERLEKLQEQLKDVVKSVKAEAGGQRVSPTANHRIACLIAEALLLAQLRGGDMETELEIVLTWFLDLDAKTTKEKNLNKRPLRKRRG